jgi:hypothetical protein
MHDRLKIVLHRGGKLSCVHHARKQDDLRSNTVGPKLESLRNARHSERINMGQVLRDGHHAVPVCICLDDGHDFRVWSGSAYDIQIVFQRSEPDVQIVFQRSEPDECPRSKTH